MTSLSFISFLFISFPASSQRRKIYRRSRVIDFLPLPFCRKSSLYYYSFSCVVPFRRLRWSMTTTSILPDSCFLVVACSTELDTSDSTLIIPPIDYNAAEVPRPFYSHYFSFFHMSSFPLVNGRLSDVYKQGANAYAWISYLNHAKTSFN